MPRSDVTRQPRLLAAALQFAIVPEQDAETNSRTGARVGDVAGPIRTTVVLLEDRGNRLCLITTHFGTNIPVSVSELFRRTIAGDLDIPESRVLIFTSHNQSSAAFASDELHSYRSYAREVPPADLLPVGREFLAALREHARRIPGMLEPVNVSWAEGHDDRITYNRKGRRDNGTAYLIREEDRVLLGDDFSGDIDAQAPVVVLKNVAGRVVAALTQFTGHPVTSYHPENPVVFGEWPQVASDLLAEHFEKQSAVPVGFLQGCAGDVSSKEMLSGNVQRSTEFGHMLGATYIEALEKQQPSRRDGLDFETKKVSVPLAPLPTREALAAELAEMDDFIQRAESGDEDTLCCVGLNFPRALSPAYRAWLVDLPRAWTMRALALYDEGRADSVATRLDMEIAVIRIGDVGLVGLPCEPFQGIGRQIRRNSPLPISIPCGYMNVSHGYITDAPNTGDREYMSSFYRYSDFRPPLQKPAGDVLADEAVRILNRFAKETTD